MSTPRGDKQRNRIHLKDAGIQKVVPNTQPILQRSVPRKPPSVLVALKQPGGISLLKYVLRSVPNPSVNSADGKSIPNTSVNTAVGNQSPNQSVNSGIQNSGIIIGVNSAQDQKVQNNAVNTNQKQKGNEISKVNSIPILNCVPSSSNVPKLEIGKEIKEKLSEPSNPIVNGHNNKTVAKVSAPKSPCPKPSVQENNTLRTSNTVSKPNEKHLDVASIISNLKFWNSTLTYNTDIQMV